MLIQNEQRSILPKTEISSTSFHFDNPKKYPSCTPNINPIATPTVYVPMHIAFNAVWDTHSRHREESSVSHERLAGMILDVKCISKLYSV
jgi:hypothetical protein